MPRRTTGAATGSPTLSRRRVDAIRGRLEASGGMLDVRRAALMDRNGAEVRDGDIVRWLTRGEELMQAGSSVEDERLPEYDRLCLELAIMGSVRGAHLLQLAGAATRRILTRTDKEAASPQVSLIKHIHEMFGRPIEGSVAATIGVSDRPAGDLDISQAEMDALTEDELSKLESLLAERMKVTGQIRTLLTSARVLRTGGAAPTVH